jgi:BMFP domain-containing protein YqiC
MLADQVKNMLTSDTNLINTLANTIASILINSTPLIENITKRLKSSLKEDVRQHVYQALSFDIQQQGQTTTTLTEKQHALDKKISTLEDKLDEYEQYSRRNCLLLHGLPEVYKENTNNIAISTIKDHLEITLTDEDIDRSHRLGRRQKDDTSDESAQMPHPRPIIIKLCSYNKRERIFKAKSKLKKTGIVITENLTAKRMALLNSTKQHESVSAAWTTDGRVQCITTSDKYMNIKSTRDLAEL